MQGTLHIHHGVDDLLRIHLGNRRHLGYLRRLFLRRISNRHQLIIRKAVYTERTEKDIQIRRRQRSVLVCQIHQISTLTQLGTLLIRDHSRQTRTLEQIIHQQVYILQRCEFLHFTVRIAKDKLRLYKRRTDEQRHLLDGHRQTDSRRIGQLTHLHRCSGCLFGIEFLDERNDRYLVNTHLRNSERIFIDSQGLHSSR